MAKKSMVARENKRAALSKKYKEKREALKKEINSTSLSIEEKMEAVWKLNSLPKNSSKVRKRNRCFLTGRPRGYYRKFGLSRIELRRLGGLGEIPGLIKSSW